MTVLNIGFTIKKKWTVTLATVLRVYLGVNIG